MAEHHTGLPTTTVRNDLLRDCLAWIGERYEGGDLQAACHQALRETLGIPLEGRITPDQFTRCVYDYVLKGFEEVLALGLHFYDDLEATGEAKVAVDAWLLFMATLQQPGRNADERRYAHVEAMVVGLEHWVSYTPGGLRDAMRSLRLLMADAV
ncbi:hypothetical protein acdb102_18230 [Acidothermaceae bacterium B102]|nr:hypothetical protein acdb102_18230 [Acidothermaceae bacterium B102]